MRINHNITSMTASGALFKANRDMSKSLEKLSTGLRINSSADDAAGLAISENLRAQVRGAAQAQRNALDGISALQIAEGAANEISDILQRMRELAVQSANDTLTTTERGYTDQEYQALIDEIDRIVDVTKFNKMTLLDGTGFGNGDMLWIDSGTTTTADGLAITITAITAPAGDLNSQANAVTAIGAIDTKIDSVNGVRADIGAYVNRLEHAINNLIVSETNQQAAESLIRDADFAKETASFTKNQILVQSSTAMLAQSNMIPSSVLSLVSGR